MVQSVFRYCVRRFSFAFRLMASTDKHSFYQLSPLKLGVEVRGINLQEDVPQSVVDQIRQDVHNRPQSRSLESQMAGLQFLWLARRLKPWLVTIDGL